MKFCLRILAMGAVVLAPISGADVVLNSGDHIAIIGNALPDRMQHDGWLETMIQAANPDKDLVIRNMGFTGDQVALRPRNENFQSFDDGLTLVGADTIFTFFGYNESFARNPVAFKAELEKFIDDMATKKWPVSHRKTIFHLSISMPCPSSSMTKMMRR